MNITNNQWKPINLKNINLNPMRRNTIMAYHHPLMYHRATCRRELTNMLSISMISMTNTSQKRTLRRVKWLRIMSIVLKENSSKLENQATIKIISNRIDRIKKIIMSQLTSRNKIIKMMRLEAFPTMTFASLSGVDSSFLL